jgi:hypothetical protein
MFQKTSNPYVFKYLQILQSGTGGTGPVVYLPEKPPEDDIHFKEEQKFIRPELSKTLAKAIRVLYAKMDSKSPHYDPSYMSPYAMEIRQWEDQQWERIQSGFWFWNNGAATYLTPFYYWYLTEWMPYFGRPDYRETDKELTYFIQYCEEDPNSYGALFNSVRRYGKSAVMAGWIVFGVTTNYRWFGGMQGETDKKIKKFWDLHVIKPFRKLMPYVQPRYDYSSKQTEEIKFERPVIKGEKSKADLIPDDDIDDTSESEDLESFLDYRASAEGEYDSAVLHRYVHEEPGKKLQASVSETWKVVKPCLRRGKFIRGKCLMGTTVEQMDVFDRGGRSYQKLFYESDFDKRGPLGQTISGMYACFLPGDASYEGFFDDYGHPMRAEAKRSIVLERESVKHNQKDYSDLIRKYPLNMSEIFWVSTDRCIFNSTILQKRKLFLDSSPVPMFSRFDLVWEGNIRFSRILIRHNPDSGWYKASWMFPGEQFEKEANQVRKNIDGTFSPLNENKFTSGIDPVDHRIKIESKMGFGEDEFISVRRSRPVMRVKRRYDSSIDGILTQELLEKRRDEEYPYQTGITIGMMDTRPNDPNVYYERSLMVCWLHGMSANVESAKPGLINYFYEHGCGDFIKNKYIPESSNKTSSGEAGTPANPQTINEYVECLMTNIEYFGHRENFIEFVNDYILFDPGNTRVHDYAVASGWCDLGEKIRPKTVSIPILNLHDIMPTFDRYGNVIQR